jgi:cortexillin 1/2
MAAHHGNSNLEERDKAWEGVQKKAFTHWVNTVLDKRGLKIENLEDSFADGLTIVNFVELLVEAKMKRKYAQQPRQRINKIENTHLALEFLIESGIQKKYMTASAEDFVDKNLKLLLGFLWVTFRRFRIAKTLGGDEDSTTEGLLLWCKQITEGYKGVNIRDFKGSFSDGHAFLAMVNAYDKKLFNYNEQLEEHSTHENIETAFALAEKHLGIPQLLDPAELADGTIDERSVVLYVSLFFHAFVSAQERMKVENEKRGILDQATALQTQLDLAKEESEVLTRKLANSEEEVKSLKSKLEEKEKDAQRLAQEKEALEKEVNDLKDMYKKLKEKTGERAALEAKGLELIRKNLLEHLGDMTTWKGYLEQDREYESEQVQARTEKEITDRSFEDQCEYLADALASENRKLEVLLKQREIEDKAAEAEREKRRKVHDELAAETGKKSKDGDKKDKKPKSARKEKKDE